MFFMHMFFSSSRAWGSNSSRWRQRRLESQSSSRKVWIAEKFGNWKLLWPLSGLKVATKIVPVSAKRSSSEHWILQMVISTRCLINLNRACAHNRLPKLLKQTLARVWAAERLKKVIKLQRLAVNGTQLCESSAAIYFLKLLRERRDRKNKAAFIGTNTKHV